MSRLARNFVRSNFAQTNGSSRSQEHEISDGSTLTIDPFRKQAAFNSMPERAV
jgi:hypothetical protein